jgi:hypothetical protein
MTDITDKTTKDLGDVLRYVCEVVLDETGDSAAPEYMYAPFRRFIYNTAKLYIEFCEDFGKFKYENNGVLSADEVVQIDDELRKKLEEAGNSITLNEEEVLLLEAARRLAEQFKPDEEDK